MLELDVLLVPFVKEVYPGLDEEDQRRYRKLLSYMGTQHPYAQLDWSAVPAFSNAAR